jgi:hypothetical protein
MGVVDAILEDDTQAPPKERHTARRIFDRLRDEHGYSGSEVTVRRDLALHKRASAEVFVPLSQLRAKPSSTSARRPSRSRGSA